MKVSYLLAFTLLFGCSGAPEKPEKPVAPASLEGSKCLGNRVPPTSYKQATAFVELTEPDAADKAREEAVAELRDRICQGYRCSEIEPKITLWNTESDKRHVCAMAVIKGSEVTAFSDKPRRELKQSLDKAGRDLVKILGKERPRIAIDNIRDNGIDGGTRAEWMIERMAGSISGAGGLVGKLPAGWAGLKIPEKVDAVLRGHITRMHGRESMLEVTWSLDLGDAFASVDPVTFPEFIGPNVDPTTITQSLAGPNHDIALRFDGRPGGGLCNGQRMELRLETAKPGHARVLNLYGEHALLIWGSKGKTKTGNAQSLGEFTAMRAEGVPPAEQFLAFATSSKGQLEKFENAPIPCRVPPAHAALLHAGNGMPSKAVTTSRSFRIVSGAECSQIPAPPLADAAAAIAAMPLCW